MAIRTYTPFGLPSSFRVLVASTPEEADARIVAEATTRWPGCRKVTLASGATFAGPYAALRDLVDRGALDLSGVEFRHLDEFMDTEPGTHGALSKEITDALFPDANPRRGRFVPTDTRRPDTLAVHESGVRGSDMVLLGVGANGHLAFNEPGVPLGSGTHAGPLTDGSRAVHQAAFARGGREVPRTALTAGPATILSGGHLLLAAKGSGKAAAVAAMLGGPISTDCPASAIRLHDVVTIVLDAAAAERWLACEVPTAVAEPEAVLDARTLDPRGPVLVVAPHPDDAGISCGGVLASLRGRVRTVIATWSTGARASRPGLDAVEGARLREREAALEAERLGAEVRFLRASAYDTGVLDALDVGRLRALIEELRPAWVFAPARADAHPTHRLCRITVDEAVAAYVRGGGSTLLFTMEGPWHQLTRSEANTLIRIDAAASGEKAHAVAAHASQMERVPFHRGADALESLRAITFSESHLGGKTTGGFLQDTRLEVFARARVGLDRPRTNG